jgi:aspartokinase/homoserine dehydrogenase 1
MAQRNLLVLKFGGSSMGSRDSIDRVMEIVQNHSRPAPIVIVVSAVAGVTDRLLALGRDALLGKTARFESERIGLRKLHEENFLPLTAPKDQKWLQQFLDQQFGDIREIAYGISLLKEFSDRTLDKLLSYGEILSANLLAKALQARDARFCYSDARDWIVAEPNRQGALLNFIETERRVRRHLRPLVARGLLPVVPGFICAAPDGVVTTLGRNGSDYSSSIVAAALRARELWIYTDVDGVMTADPTLVAEASILPQVSYSEAAEMSYFGAKVLHPKSMIPAVVHRIPIRIKNTFNPEAPGTLITDRSLRRPLVKTVTSVRDLALLNIQGNGMVGIPGVASRLFDALARQEINVMMISQSSSEHSICMVLRTGDANRAVEAIEREFRLERERNLIEEVGLTRNVSIVSIIGAGMHGTPGISGKFFEALGKHRTNVLAIAQGSSELNISAVILERDYKQAVQAIHTAFGLTNDLHVFVFGCGNIGRMLLKQIQENREHLSRGSKINLKVLGVSDSRHWRFVPAGLTGAELKLLGLGKPLRELAGSDKRPSTDEIFRHIVGTFKSDIVIVDATAAELAPTHIEGLRRGFHVVTANKKPLTSSLGEYQEIQRLRRRKGLNYQYEATFGAGLPLLYTLQDLINTGDKILRIQGCLSGTLGILCSRMDEGVPFSRAVSEAMARGYTEPDPRDDLSGIDVARKALIIARELGRSLELSQIRLTAMLPRKFFKLKTVASFLARLTEADKKMAQAVQKAHGQGNVLRYIADISQDGCVVGPRSILRDTPIGRLSGPDNILVFQTTRYFEHPLVIQGPGAGAGVTAAGVLSDILKIAKSI